MCVYTNTIFKAIYKYGPIRVYLDYLKIQSPESASTDSTNN